MTKQEAVNHFGSASRVAEALNLTRAAVSQWPELVPELRQLQLERITGGKLRAESPATKVAAA